MRATLLIIPLLLSACATPRESCLAEVTREARVIDALITQTRGNLERGFAIEEEQDIRTRRRFCTGRNEDGSVFQFRCEETDTVTVQVPVAVDLNAERAKLESLLQRQQQNQANVQAGIAQCNARFPAES